MSLNTTNLLKNLNGSILFFFFILFTAPLGADDIISGNTDDERRRSGKGVVVVKLLSHSEPSRAQSNSANQDREITSANSPENQTQNAAWGLQPGIDQHIKELDQRAEIKSFKTVNETEPSEIQWIGTVISETGPPSFPDNSTSYLAGHDNYGRLPQVTRIETPVIVSENIVHRIHRKTASVRTPTGPPDTPVINFTSRKHQSGKSPSPSFATPDFYPFTRIYSRSMQAILRGDRLRLST